METEQTEAEKATQAELDLLFNLDNLDIRLQGRDEDEYRRQCLFQINQYAYEKYAAQKQPKITDDIQSFIRWADENRYHYSGYNGVTKETVFKNLDTGINRMFSDIYQEWITTKP